MFLLSYKIEGKGLSVFNTLSYADFAIPAEQAVFLSGPSGCGKSTLLRLMNGILTPSEGHIFLDGADIASLDPIALRRRVLLAGQAVYLFRGTIADNFRLFHQYRETTAPDAKTCQSLLDLCQAPFTPEDSCQSLSGGERQRIFLALALSMKPEVLLLDEPHSAMDSALAYKVMGNIIAYGRDHHMTMIIISHDLKLRDTCADKIIRLGESS